MSVFSLLHSSKFVIRKSLFVVRNSIGWMALEVRLTNSELRITKEEREGRTKYAPPLDQRGEVVKRPQQASWVAISGK